MYASILVNRLMLAPAVLLTIELQRAQTKAIAGRLVLAAAPTQDALHCSCQEQMQASLM